MPATASLHIQAKESDPARVVVLAGGSVRIGRASYCEVRLPSPEVAEEECRLRRRGGSWHVFPVGSNGSVRLEGRPIDESQPIPFDVPFRVGGHELTLRLTGTSSEVAWEGAIPSPPPVIERAISLEGLPIAPAPVLLPAHATADPRSRMSSHERRLRAQLETRRWESRWRSFGEKLGNSTAPVAPAPASVGHSKTPMPNPSLRAQGQPRAPVSRVRHVAPRPIEPVAFPLPETVPVRPFLAVTPRADSSALAPLPPPVASANVAIDLDSTHISAPIWDRGEGEKRHGVARQVLAKFAPPANLDPVIEAREDERDAARGPTLVLGAARKIGRHRGVLEPSQGNITVDDEARDPALVEVASIRATETFLDRTEVELLEPEPPLDPFALSPLEDASPRETDPIPHVPARDAQEIGPRLQHDPVSWSYHDPIVTDTSVSDSAFHAPQFGGSRDSKTGRDDAPIQADAHATFPKQRVSAREWPTVVDILAARAAQPLRSATVRAAKNDSGRLPAPTVARAPASWSVPFALGFFPALMVVTAIGVIASLASWGWVIDAYSAGLVAARLAPGSSHAKPLPEWVTPNPSTWWRTTAAHLVEWSAYLDRGANDAAAIEEVRRLLDHALQTSPLERSARFALAHPLDGETNPPLARVLAQPRDVVALTWSGRRLFEEGKQEAARAAYASALEMAAHADLERTFELVFLDDPRVRRYALPTEDLIGPVVRSIAGHRDWKYENWADLVPRGTAARLVVARVLRALGSPDAEAALDAALAEADPSVRNNSSDHPLRLAAAAEAFALKERWAAADELYRQAIERTPDGLTRRSWWMNVADLARRLDDEPKRLAALDLAKSTDPKDEITQRAIELQKAAGTALNGNRRTPVDGSPTPRVHR